MEIRRLQPGAGCLPVEARDGRAVGYAALFDVRDHCDLSGDVYVHPEFKGLGVDAALLRAMEIRAREHVRLAVPGHRVFIPFRWTTRTKRAKPCSHATAICPFAITGAWESISMPCPCANSAGRV